MRELTQPVKEGVGEYDPTLTTRSVIASRNAATSHEEPKISINAVERLKKIREDVKSDEPVNDGQQGGDDTMELQEVNSFVDN